MLEIKDIKVELDAESGLVRAIDGMRLSLQRGETFALVGESGCGKSMTALALMRLLPENGHIVAGDVLVDGDDVLALPESKMRAVRGGRIGIGLVVTLITYASLIVGELVPKQIALRDPEAVAVKVAPAMTLLAKASLPLVWLLDQSGQAILWLLGHRGQAADKVSEAEIHTVVAEAETAGVLEPGEKEMIAGVMRLGDLPVGAVMTPRHEVAMINLGDDDAVIYKTILGHHHSRFAVFDGDRDAAIGIIQAKDLLDAYLADETPNLRELVRDAPIIPETVDARDVVAILRESPVHIGLVHDEYGVFQGVVTSADILESIVGSFHTEEGPAERAFVQRADGSYLISGWMPALEFASLLGITLPPQVPYQTFAGYLLQAFGTIPEVGARIDLDGWRFEIMDLDGRRIDKVLASRREEEKDG